MGDTSKDSIELQPEGHDKDNVNSNTSIHIMSQHDRNLYRSQKNRNIQNSHSRGAHSQSIRRIGNSGDSGISGVSGVSGISGISGNMGSIRSTGSVRSIRGIQNNQNNQGDQNNPNNQNNLNSQNSQNNQSTHNKFIPYESSLRAQTNEEPIEDTTALTLALGNTEPISGLGCEKIMHSGCSKFLVILLIIGSLCVVGGYTYYLIKISATTQYLNHNYPSECSGIVDADIYLKNLQCVDVGSGTIVTQPFSLIISKSLTLTSNTDTTYKDKIGFSYFGLIVDVTTFGFAAIFAIVVLANNKKYFIQYRSAVYSGILFVLIFVIFEIKNLLLLLLFIDPHQMIWNMGSIICEYYPDDIKYYYRSIVIYDYIICVTQFVVLLVVCFMLQINQIVKYSL